MIDNAADDHYEDALLSEVKALPPGELISDIDLSEKHGLVPQVWGPHAREGCVAPASGGRGRGWGERRQVALSRS